jgi:hypothetical protein
MPVDNGGPAFPTSGSELSADGMRLRDYFAAHAPFMPNEWAAYRRTQDADETQADAQELKLMAEWAFYWADLMIAARRGAK